LFGPIGLLPARSGWKIVSNRVSYWIDFQLLDKNVEPDRDEQQTLQYFDGDDQQNMANLESHI
jgi:hypothetical protein